MLMSTQLVAKRFYSSLELHSNSLRVVLVAFPLRSSSISQKSEKGRDFFREGCDKKRHKLKRIFSCARASHSSQKCDNVRHPPWAATRALARASMWSQCRCRRVTVLSFNLRPPQQCVVRSDTKVGLPFGRRMHHGGRSTQIDKMGRPAEMILSWNSAQVV